MEKKTRAVLVGCGFIAGTWLNGLKEIPEAEVVGLVDIDPGAPARLAEKHGLTLAAQGTDLEATLQQTRPDVVFNCTTPAAHMDVTLTALRHGCHVLGEKPLADSLDSAWRMIEAARDAGRIFAVIQHRRYNPRVQRLRSFLVSGALGAITTVNCDLYRGAHPGGFRERMRHVLLLDMAIHTFDSARLIAGADATSVFCHEWNPAGSWYDHDASAVAIFQMTGGIVFSYRGSCCSEGVNTVWDCDWRIVGEKGSVRWDGADGFQAQVAVKGGTFISELATVEVPVVDAGSKVGGHIGNIREFIRCVREGGVPETAAADNIRSLAMVFGAIESAETGRSVAIQERG